MNYDAWLENDEASDGCAGDCESCDLEDCDISRDCEFCGKTFPEHELTLGLCHTCFTTEGALRQIQA
jgi:hypothetical protein